MGKKIISWQTGLLILAISAIIGITFIVYSIFMFLYWLLIELPFGV